MAAETKKKHNPYVGPRSFRRGEDLYGRDRERIDLLNLIIPERIVLLYSPSGAGKTSLIQASLTPKLVSEGFSVLPMMRVSNELPAGSTIPLGANRYLLSLLLSLEEARQDRSGLGVADLANMSLDDYLTNQLPEAVTGQDGVVLIFDQFEEILTINPTDIDQKVAFFKEVGKALRDRSRWAIFAMREDYIAGIDAYVRYLPTQLRSRYRLDLLDQDGAMEAVQRPAGAENVDFTESAARQLIDELRLVRVQQAGDVTEMLGPTIEPVQLQVVCHRVWNIADYETDNQIDPADLEKVGNVTDALGGYYADQVKAAATQKVPEEQIRRWIERELITAQGIRGQVLQQPERSRNLPNVVIEQLVDSYLVRSENRRGAIWYELAHDRLIDPIRASNEVWFEGKISALERQVTLSHSQGHPVSLLITTAEALAEAKAQAGDNPDDHTRTFFAKSQDYIDEKQQNEKRNLQIAAIIATLLALSAIVATFFAFTNLGAARVSEANAVAAQEEAETALDRANMASTEEAAANARAQELLITSEAAEAEAILSANLAESRREIAVEQAATAAALQEEAIRERATAEAAQATAETAQLEAITQAELATEKTSELLAAQAVGNLAVDPELGLLLAVASFQEDATALARSALLQSLQSSASARVEFDQVLSDPSGNSVVAYSPDGREIAVGGFADRIIFFDAETGERLPRELQAQGVPSRIIDMAFHPTADLLIVLSADRMVRVWAWLDDRKDPVSSFAYEINDSVTSLAMSPIGQSFATGGQLTTIALWNLDGFVRSVDTKMSNVQDIVYSPDGRLVAVVGDSSGARGIYVALINPVTGEVVGGTETDDRFRGHQIMVTSVTFSPNGSQLYTGDINGNVIVWDIETGEELRRLEGSGGRITALALSPFRRTLAAGLDTGGIVLWDIDDGTTLERPEQRHQSSVTDLAFSLDGTSLVSTSSDLSSSIVRWNVSAQLSLFGTRLLELPGPIQDIAPANNRIIEIDVRQEQISSIVDTGYMVSYCRTVDCEAFSLLYVDLDGNIVAEIETPVLLDHMAPVPQLPESIEAVCLFALGPNGELYMIEVAPEKGEIDLVLLGENVSAFAINALRPPRIALVVDGETHMAPFMESAVRLDDSFVETIMKSSVTIPTADVLEVQFSNSQSMVAVRSVSELTIYDIETLEIERLIQLSTVEYESVGNNPDRAIAEISAMAFSDNDNFIVLGDVDGSILHFAIKSNDVVDRFYSETMSGRIVDIVVVDDGSMLVVADANGALTMFDTRAGIKLGQSVAGHSDVTTSLAVSATGQWFASASEDGTLFIWEARAVDWVDTACNEAQRNFDAEEWVQFFGDLTDYRITCAAFPAGYVPE